MLPAGSIFLWKRSRVVSRGLVGGERKSGFPDFIRFSLIILQKKDKQLERPGSRPETRARDRGCESIHTPALHFLRKTATMDSLHYLLTSVDMTIKEKSCIMYPILRSGALLRHPSFLKGDLTHGRLVRCHHPFEKRTECCDPGPCIPAGGNPGNRGFLR